MIRLAHLIRRLRDDRRGATVVEFALIAPVFFMILMGTMDLGYQAWFRSTMNGVMEDAARRAAVGGISPANTDEFIKARLQRILPASERTNEDAITIEKKSFSDFSRIGQPEVITNDADGDSIIDIGDCWEDANSNGAYDIAASSGVNGQGSAEDVVYYEVTAEFPRLFPMPTMLGWDENMVTTVQSAVRNQPFGEQVITNVCRT
jgi:Flp pilus assembly pilin Flp